MIASFIKLNFYKNEFRNSALPKNMIDVEAHDVEPEKGGQEKEMH